MTNSFTEAQMLPTIVDSFSFMTPTTPSDFSSHIWMVVMIGTFIHLPSIWVLAPPRQVEPGGARASRS